MNPIRHHPHDSTLVAYASGTLSAPLALVVATHLDRCPECRSRVRVSTEIGGALLNGMPSDSSPGLGIEQSLDRCWSAIQQRIGADSQPSFSRLSSHRRPVLDTYLPAGLDELDWRELTNGISRFPLRGLSDEGAAVSLFRFQPGSEVPSHGHERQEMSIVLQGAYVDEIGRFEVGDVADLDETVTHHPVVVGDVPCIALIATDGDVNFTDPRMRGLSRWFHA